MPYIGKSPAVGNFVKLDAISTSSTNTYNLTLDSVAFSPESPNHCMVSLNGVIQSPSTSFSISGSTITFIPSSGTLSSSDSIDFIMVYGNILDIGVCSDATVTNAKTNFVSTSSNAGLQIKGDGTTDGTLQLNCSQNTHGIKLKSPAHSASASYTLTFPNNDGDADQVLTTDGSGVLTWASAGGQNTPAFQVLLSSSQSINSGTSTVIAFDTEIFDSDNAVSSGTFTVPSGKAGKYFFAVNGGMQTGNNIDYVNLWISKNGQTTLATTSGFAIAVEFHHEGAKSSNQVQSVSGTMDLAVGDSVRVYILHNFGSSKGTASHGRFTFSGHRLIT